MPIDVETWAAMPEISAAMPVVFNSGLEFNGFNPQCLQCGHAYQAKYLRGELTMVKEDQCHLSAYGYCEQCQTLTRYELMIHDDDPPRVVDCSNSVPTLVQ